jgi:ribose/xylose/arabinose/galactoside ABC-type transport system permease subunit
MHVDRARQLSILAFLLLLALALFLYAPGFFYLQNIEDILVNTSYLSVAAMGMMLVILTGQIDLSVGSVLAICSTAAALASKAGAPIWAVFAVALGLGATLGFLNGILVTGLRVHSLIVTLGTMNLYRGALIYYTQGDWIYDLPPSFREVGLGRFLEIPHPIWVALLTAGLMAWILTRTPWGRGLYAVGSNPGAARLTGLHPSRILLAAFTANGLLVGLAAMLYATRFSAIQSNTGIGFELLVIAAAVVGGVNIFGGSGTVLGVLLGALLMSTIGTALTFFRVSSFWEPTLRGFFILLAVAFDTLRGQGYGLWRRRRSKRGVR